MTGINKLLQIEDRIFTEWRLRLYGSGLIFIFFAMIWAMFVYMHWPLLPSGNPDCIDFGVFWLSGKLAVAGGAARGVFDHSAFTAAQTAFFDPMCPITVNGIAPNLFWYPPTFLFFTYPFGLMSYVIALAVWIITSFVFYQAAVYAIIPRPTTLIAAVAPIFVILVNIQLGQNGFITAAFIGLSLVLMQRFPVISGIFLALLTYKPQFGLLFPIALLASRNWRVISSAAVVTTVLVVLAVIAFGYEGWVSFVNGSIERTSWGMEAAPGIRQEFQTVFGLFLNLGAGKSVAWSAQLVVSIIVTLGIWRLWSKQISPDLKAAALCAGSLLVSPYSMFYDLTILPIGTAFLVKDGLAHGFLPGERMAVVTCWALLLYLPFHWPRGPVVCVILLVSIARRIVASRPVVRFRPSLSSAVQAALK